MKIKLFILLIVTFSVISCGKDESIDEKSVQNYPIVHNFSNIIQSVFSMDTNLQNRDELQTFVIDNQNDWDNFIDLCDSGNYKYSNDFSEINIDFNNYMILVVIDKIYPNALTGQDAIITITDVLENQNDMTVKMDSTVTGSSTTVTPNPFHVIKTDKISKPVDFIFN